ncbi:DUF4340 domain-containing protein [Haliangium sp.]|uniref:DUF4340 domain-containing protein n=1 Tax=Haliangium sp. TaxID=2663208 RepID=UPI003D11371E
MSTFNKILIAALAVQVALAVIIQARSGSDEQIRRPEPLLAKAGLDQATRIAIYDFRAPDKGEAEAPAIELRREGDGEHSTWVLGNYWGAPTKSGTVTELIDKLAALRTSGPAVTSEVRHDQLEVAADHYRRKLEIESPSGVTTLYVGKPSRARTTFVRMNDDTDVHAVSGISDGGISALVTSWMDNRFFEADFDRVTSLSVVNQNGSYEFARGEDGAWQYMQGEQPYPIPEGKKLNAIAVTNWVKSMVRIVSTQPEDPNRDLSQPLATITVRLKPAQPAGEAGEVGEAGETGEAAVSEAPEEHVFEIGPESENENAYYLRMRGTSKAIRVAKARIRPVVDMNDEVVLISAED